MISTFNKISSKFKSKRVFLPKSEKSKKFLELFEDRDKDLVYIKPELFYLDMLDFGVDNKELISIEKRYKNLNINGIINNKELIYKTIDLNIMRLWKTKEFYNKDIHEILQSKLPECDRILIKINFRWRATPSDILSSIIDCYDGMSEEEKDVCRRFLFQRLNHSLDTKLNILYKSWRLIPLVTQRNDIKMLTVEEWNKWYDYYVIDGDAIKSLLHSYENLNIWELLEEHIFGHCISPKGFLLAAQKIGAKVDRNTYNAVVEMFIEEYYDEDPKDKGVEIIEECYLPSNELKDEILIP